MMIENKFVFGKMHYPQICFFAAPKIISCSNFNSLSETKEVAIFLIERNVEQKDGGNVVNPSQISFTWGAIKRGWGTCGTFQSFPVISAYVPCTYYVHRDI